MTRIFIEGQELDVNEGFSNQLNFSIDDLSKLDTKTTSFSKTIVLPGTTKNNKLLGNIFEFGNSNFTTDSAKNVGYNFNASKSAQARIEVDSMQVMKGVLRLMEIIRDGDYIEYEIAIFGELGGFFSSLGAKKIEELDFSSYNHQYSITNIVNSWNTSGSTGYCYPLIEYGNTSYQGLKHDFYYTAFRPALFAREYIDKIITGAGYTWESNFFNSAFFRRLIVPNNQNRLSVKKNDIFFSNFGSQSFSNGYSPTLSNVIAPLFTTADNKEYTYTSGTGFSGVINYQVSGQYSVGSVNAGDSAFATLTIYKNSSLFYVSTAIKIGGQSPIASRYYNLNFSNVPISFINNDKFKFVVTYFDVNGGILTGTITGGTVAMYTDNPILQPINLNDQILINNTIPVNVLQKDFFASIIKMFNLMITEDKYKEKHLVIEPYVDFYESTYEDWSDVVDRSKPIRIKPMSEINARYYTIKYKQDADFFNEAYRKKYNEGYGDRTYDNQLEFAKDNDGLEVIFSNSVLVGYSGEDKIFPAIYKLNNNVEESTEHNIRIMQMKKISSVGAWTIRDSGGAVVGSTNTDYLYSGHLDNPDAPNADLCFGVPNELQFELASGALSNNLFNAYYSPYFAEITDKDSRLLKCKIKFNLTDIYNIDFRKFIRIDGVLYRLYKITDWVDGEVCDVELLRVNYTTY